MKVALYARRSGDREEKAAVIETQIEEMEKWCQAHGHSPVAWYRDDNVQNETPMRLRPDGGRLLREAKAGRFQGVVVYETGRLSRVMHSFFEILGEFDRLDLRLFSTNHEIDRTTPTGIAFLHLEVVFTEWDRNQIAWKFMNARERVARDTYRAEDGEEYHYWLGGVTPYGYRSVVVNRRRGLAIDSTPLPGRDYSTADVVRWIFRWTVEDLLGSLEIAELLNTRGVPKHHHLRELGIEGHGLRGEKLGRPAWTSGDVSNILRRDYYCGRHHWGKEAKAPREIVERRVPAVISPAMFAQAQQIIAAKRLFVKPNTKENRYLLRGRIRCGYCGHSYAGSNVYGGRPRKEGIWYYRCSAKNRRYYQVALNARGLVRCINQVVDSRLEEVVWSQICELAAHPNETLDTIRTSLSRHREWLAERTCEGDELRRRLERNLYGQRACRKQRQQSDDSQSEETDYLSQVDFQEMMADYKREEQRLRRQIEQVDEMLDQCRQVERQIAETVRIVADLGADLANWEWDRKRWAIEQIVKEVIVYPSVPGEEDRQIEVVYQSSERAIVRISHSP